MHAHAASDFTNRELLLVLVAERLDRLVDRMMRRGHSRLALFGSRAHAIWMWDNIEATRGLPVTAFIDRPDRPDERRDIGVPVLRIDDPEVPRVADTVLIADDRCEVALHALALRHLPPGIMLHRLYERLAIGAEPLGGPAAEVAHKPAVPAGRRIIHPAAARRAAG